PHGHAPGRHAVAVRWVRRALDGPDRVPERPRRRRKDPRLDPLGTGGSEVASLAAPDPQPRASVRGPRGLPVPRAAHGLQRPARLLVELARRAAGRLDLRRARSLELAVLRRLAARTWAHRRCTR